MSRPAAPAGAPPAKPPAWEETASQRLFLFLSPNLPAKEQPPTPPGFAPFDTPAIPRRRGPGTLSATFFPASEPARGAVLLLHPWLVWGRAYFHRYGRLEALRAAGYHALTLDLPGFGASPPPRPAHGYFDRAVEDGLAYLEQRCPDVPIHLWGVSSGGYWAHPVLGRRGGVAGAFFEDVAAHLLEWSWRVAPLGRPFYLLFRLLYRRGYRYLDLRRHAPHLKVERAAYVSGALDHGVTPTDTSTLARLAGAKCRIVPSAGHLESIKTAGDSVIGLALETFREAEQERGREIEPGGKVLAFR